MQILLVVVVYIMVTLCHIVFMEEMSHIKREQG